MRPGSFLPLPADPGRKGRVEKAKFHPPPCPARVKGVVELPPAAPDLRAADVVISLGMGVLKDGSGKPKAPREAYGYAEQLKAAIERRYHIKAEIGATRALIYSEVKELGGPIGKANQAGQTGSTVRPKVYFAVGISGAVQHCVGMQNFSKLLAINSDPDAPILKIAHYPIVGDPYEVLPNLVRVIGGGRVAE